MLIFPLPFRRIRVLAAVLALEVIAVAAPDGAGAAPAPGESQAVEATGSFFKGKVDVTIRLSRTGFEVAKENSSQPRGAGFPSERLFATAQRSQARVRTSVSKQPIPMRFHLRLTNSRGDPVVVEVRRMEAAGEKLAVSPMINLVPEHGTAITEPIEPEREITVSEVPVTLELRIGKRRETQTLLLRTVATPASGDAEHAAGAP